MLKIIEINKFFESKTISTLNEKQKYVYDIMKKNKKELSKIGSFINNDKFKMKKMMTDDTKLKFKINETVSKFYMSKDNIKKSKNKYRYNDLAKDPSINTDGR